MLDLSEPPPTGVGGFFRIRFSIEPFGLPIHHQTGVWCFNGLINRERMFTKYYSSRYTYGA